MPQSRAEQKAAGDGQNGAAGQRKGDGDGIDEHVDEGGDNAVGVHPIEQGGTVFPQGLEAEEAIEIKDEKRHESKDQHAHGNQSFV